MADTDKYQLFHFIIATSFVLDDLRLFLDTHPTEMVALEYFQSVQTVRNEAVQKYTNYYAPICSYNVAPSDDWSWGNEPWPWEGECK